MTNVGVVTRHIDRLPVGVKGWFTPLDQVLFDWFLSRQREEPLGDLVELGVYFGKSAILIGSHLRSDERFTVCDLFETPANDAPNREECDSTYGDLTRAAFEENYLSAHPELPTVVQAQTSEITEHVAPGSCRFAHIDASHIYEHVARDVDSVREMLRPDGLAVFDDFRAKHTPGTAAAVWEGVLNKGLRPICVTRKKLYGTWGNPFASQDSLMDWLTNQPDVFHDLHDIAGDRVLRLWVIEPTH